MRHVIGTSSAAAAGMLCVLALVGSNAPIAALGGAQTSAAAAPIRTGAPCAGAAWPYPPGACAEIGEAGTRPPRFVRLIAVAPTPHPR
jgi:hypothetical protein